MTLKTKMLIQAASVWVFAASFVVVGVFIWDLQS